LSLFAKEGIIPPFGKGRIGGILQNNVVIILRLLIIHSELSSQWSSFLCQRRIGNPSVGEERFWTDPRRSEDKSQNDGI